MIEIRNLFHEGGSPADLRYKAEERKRPWEIAEKTVREECTLDWSQSKVFLVLHFGYPSLIRRPRYLSSFWNFALQLTVKKIESWGYPPVKTGWSESFWHDTSLIQPCMLTRCKNVACKGSINNLSYVLSNTESVSLLVTGMIFLPLCIARLWDCMLSVGLPYRLGIRFLVTFSQR